MADDEEENIQLDEGYESNMKTGKVNEEEME